MKEFALTLTIVIVASILIISGLSLRETSKEEPKESCEFYRIIKGGYLKIEEEESRSVRYRIYSSPDGIYAYTCTPYAIDEYEKPPED